MCGVIGRTSALYLCKGSHVKHQTLLLYCNHISGSSREPVNCASNGIVPVSRRGRNRDVQLDKSGVDQTGEAHRSIHAINGASGQ
jgi:hypothetical protein